MLLFVIHEEISMLLATPSVEALPMSIEEPDNSQGIGATPPIEHHHDLVEACAHSSGGILDELDVQRHL
jgi:hypothetical protein